MHHIAHRPQEFQPVTEDAAPLILPLSTIDASMPALVGGKAANLGELVHAGFAVPDGFCVTTEAYTRVSREANLEPLFDEFATIEEGDRASLQSYASAVRTRLIATPTPSDIQEIIAWAYDTLGHGKTIPVAVRSSATAEDLPFASFAGQQETYLNVVGLEAVLDAVRRCWLSLWTERAISYRASNGIDQRTVRLAVVVQLMVNTQVAGVLFTADPLTGQRRQVVIDASPGLGEAVVSGVVTPDHFVVNTQTDDILERRLGDKQVLIQALPGGGTRRMAMAEEEQHTPCLADEQVIHLTKLGKQVESHYGSPQDIEWAIDRSGQLWLTQARPITTLFPLPATAATAEDLRVYLSFNVLQGVYRPFTPMGFAALRLMASSIALCAGLPPRDVLAGPTAMTEAAHRIFLDITPVLSQPLGRKVLKRVMGRLEARSGAILQQLADDARLPSTSRVSPGRIGLWALSTLVRTRALLYISQVLFFPSIAQRRVLRLQEQLRALSHVPLNTGASQRLATVERLLLKNTAATICHSLFTALPAFLLTVVAGKLLGDLATRDERQVVMRALPHNPTTEMDLALWQLAQTIREDVNSAHLFLDTPREQLVQDYHAGILPPVLQQGLADFLRTYGHRGVAEIDLGLPRWSEDPTHILGVLTNYLLLARPEVAPDVQFQRAGQEAEAMVTELMRRARKRGWLRSKLVGICLKRGRALAGMREMAKYYLVLLLAGARDLLLPVGEELVRVGHIEKAEDIFFIDLSEARQALAGEDVRALVAERRGSYDRELERRHVPRVLLSDGTNPEVTRRSATTKTERGDEITLDGIPASTGMVTAKARVILNPVGASLEPGEILVAPSTDPGWTPLFLTASGMVMEMGGPMSHGAVVAREYGIAAVVGVPGATSCIKTGQLITIDGSSGTIVIHQETSEATAK
ncbi:MAG: phosphoenolpyruvate synthase [Ktedonobacteraceae bacterium]|nr:phosphoenolpyruvate synthase [Ktedonobacteraceae bacterium]